jgi:uncharacterized protein (DUF1684 family)
MRRNGALFLSLLGILILVKGVPAYGEGTDGTLIAAQAQKVQDWRKERDVFFKSHQRSPLTPDQKIHFKGLKYYSFDPKYVFSGQIERYILNINNPQYYATFLTNKGTNKRYIRYGKFRFQIEGKDCSLEVYKSILSDNLFIPFKDKTNGKETYEAGRYIETEILNGYKMVLDFNMGYFPSCAYNDKFVCALPPKENSLSVEIRAGEKNYKP